jgi:hypothetical protein
VNSKDSRIRAHRRRTPKEPRVKLNHGRPLGWTYGVWIEASLVLGFEDLIFNGREYPGGPKAGTHMIRPFGNTRVNGSEGPRDITWEEFAWRKEKSSRSHEE